MKNYSLYINTKYHFGPNTVSLNLVNELKQRKYKKCLIMYGGGSIKKNGIYDTVIKCLKQAKLSYVEHTGVQPNPLDTDTDKAIKLGRKNKVDLIIAVGGGSVIDEAKVVAELIPNPIYKNTWGYVQDQSKLKNKAIDVFSIITIAATASENNYNSVITNEKTHDKWGVVNRNRPIVCLWIQHTP